MSFVRLLSEVGVVLRIDSSLYFVRILGVIESLRLVDFRCFEEVRLAFGDEGHLFVGENAQGKTSLLEAVCVLLRLQSPRARRMSLLAREGGEEFGVAGEVGGTSLQVRGGGSKLTLRLEGEEVTKRQDYLSESGLVVWMGNEDLELVRGSGEVRRRFLDFLGTQLSSEYRFHWGRYRKALVLRNRLLKSYPATDGEVLVYTKMLVEHGSEMVRFREKLCEQLGPKVGANQRAIGGAREDLHMEYRDCSKGDLEQAFEKMVESETRRGVTLVGPHRDEVRLLIGGRSARDYGSEGQQRTVALALKLAQGEILLEQENGAPIYLIDDVFGELDPGRRNALMARLPRGAQKLITTTNLDWWEKGELNLEVMKVSEGTVR